MIRHVKRISKKIGMMPGAVVYVGQEREEPPVIEVISYTPDEISEKSFNRAEDCFEYRDNGELSWINVSGVHDVEMVKKICDHYGIHALIQEDIVNTGLRPKFDYHDKTAFVSLKMLIANAEGIQSEQVSIAFGEGYVLSFQEKPGDVLDPVRERIQRLATRVRFMKSDYLAYAIIDCVVDYYYAILENVAERTEDLEDSLLENSTESDLVKIHELKSELLFLRKAVWPLREVAGELERGEIDLIDADHRIYFRDLYEHVLQVIDNISVYREMVAGVLDIYLSSVSNRMNQVMKVLTVIATIFIPLSFLAGVYGMNFDTASPFNLPELGFKYGYLFFWVLVFVVGAGLLILFRRKRWI